MFESFRKAASDKYIGGCIFVDHTSGYVHVEFKFVFSANETICAKQNLEHFAFNNGVIPITYLRDSGVFKANKFVQHSCDHNQKIQYCGTNAHHQNGVTERANCTISNMGRAMLLYALVHLKQGIKSSMWLITVKYATYVSNILPRASNISPSDSITTQFHVVFDNHFSTVPSIAREEDPPSNWSDLCVKQTEYIPIDTPAQLSPK